MSALAERDDVFDFEIVASPTDEQRDAAAAAPRTEPSPEPRPSSTVFLIDPVRHTIQVLISLSLPFTTVFATSVAQLSRVFSSPRPLRYAPEPNGDGDCTTSQRVSHCVLFVMEQYRKVLRRVHVELPALFVS